jgi:hypothetical protein
MRANFALVSELGLPRIESEYWRELLSRGRQDHGGKEGFLDREDLWANFRNNVILVADGLKEHVAVSRRTTASSIGCGRN